jgi:hypothetical protein
MSENIHQIFIANPAVSLQDTDLMYLGRSPYGVGNDMAVQFSVIKSLFLQTANNLSDLPNKPTARTNLGLGTAATKTASSNIPSILASVSGPTSAGNIATFIDTTGTLLDVGIPFTNLAALSGSTFTGAVTLASDPVLPLQAATKQYVDTQVSAVFKWTDITTSTQTLAPNNGYTAHNGGTVAFSLPVTCPYGAIIKIVGHDANWTVSQNAGQRIRVGDIATTSGVGGALLSTENADYIELLCTTANTTFQALGMQGNLQTA